MTVAARLPPGFSLLVKPGGPDCNLACSYCFYRRVASLFPETPRHRMSDEVLEAMIQRLLSLRLPVSAFSWQGGEPTLLGLPFFERAVLLQKKHGVAGQRVANSLQTNGLLLDDEWCRFFARYRFLLGLSIDGPAEVHDRYRVGPSGRGSHEAAMRAAELLRKHGVEFNILCVLSKANAGRARETLSWFRENGFRWLQLIPSVERDPDTGGIADYSCTPEQYADYLLTEFRLWREWGDVQGTSFRTIDSFVSYMLGEGHAVCTFHRDCGSYAVVEHDGGVYPCDFFVAAPWRIGSVLESGFEELYAHPRFTEFRAAKAGLLPSRCRDCTDLPACRGGCLKDRAVFRDRFDDLTWFCPAYREFLATARPGLRDVADRLRRERR